MKKLILISFVLVLAFAACKKDDDSPAQQSQTSDNTPAVKVTSSDIYSPEELSQAIAEGKYLKSYFGDGSNLSNVMTRVCNLITNTRLFYIDTLYAKKEGVSIFKYQRDWQIESHTFTYRSVSSTGEPVTLSGRVTFPNSMKGGHQVKSLSVYTHYIISADVVPSMELSPIDLRVLFNSAVIQPDMQGFGAASHLPSCGFSYATEGRQIYDCVVAALDVMRQNGVELADNGYTTAWGYSVAMPATMAFIRHYDENLTNAERDAIRLKSAYVGGGPMMLDRLLQNLDDNLSFNAALLRYVIPYMSALPRTMLGGYALQDLVPEWMLTTNVTLDGKQYSFFDAKVLSIPGVEAQRPEQYPTSELKNHFASDMCTADGHLDYNSGKTKMMLNLFHQLSDWGAWRPAEDIYITHCSKDNCMPVDQDRAFYDSKSFSGKLHWKTVSSFLGRLVYSDDIHSGATLAETINVVLYEDPATAFRFNY